MRRLLPLPATEVEDLWDLYDLPEAAHLRAGFVQSLDGVISVDGSSRPLSSPPDRAALRTLRAVADVVLVGAGTARREDYGPIPLPADLRLRRTRSGRPERPALAVVTRDAGRLNPGARLFQDPTARVLVITATAAPDHLPAHVELVLLPGPELDPTSAVEALREQCGPRVLCEGGPHLLAQLLEADAVDELCVTIAPHLVGAGPGLLPSTLAHPLALTLASLVELDGVLLSRWALVREPRT